MASYRRGRNMARSRAAYAHTPSVCRLHKEQGSFSPIAESLKAVDELKIGPRWPWSILLGPCQGGL